MSDSSSTSPTVWDRLRERMEQIRAAQAGTADPAALAQKRARRAKILRARRQEAAQADIPLVFLAFHKGRQHYGIPIDDVLEVQALDQFTPVPRTPPFVPGVTHWRGAILSLLDLGKLFEIPESGLADLHFSVIVEAAGKRVAVVAANMEEIFIVPRNELKPAPELPGNAPAEWVIGVHDDNRLVVRMDLILQDGRLAQWRN